MSVIGSAEASAIRIADATVSRIHADIGFDDDGVWIRDLGSRNGTYVEEIHNALAWVLYTHNQAVNSGFIGHGGGPVVGPTVRSAVPPQPCQFLDGIDAMNAATGQELFAEGGTAEHDPIHF